MGCTGWLNCCFQGVLPTGKWSENELVQSRPTLYDLMDYACGSWNSPGQNIRVGSLSLLQGIFPTQGSNPGLPHCRQIRFCLSHQESPRIPEWIAYTSFRATSWPRNRTGVSCTVGGFFTNWAMREELCLPVKFISIRRRPPGQHFLFPFSIPQQKMKHYRGISKKRSGH